MKPVLTNLGKELCRGNGDLHSGVFIHSAAVLNRFDLIHFKFGVKRKRRVGEFHKFGQEFCRAVSTFRIEFCGHPLSQFDCGIYFIELGRFAFYVNLTNEERHFV